MEKINEITLKQLYEFAYNNEEPFVTYKNEGVFAVANMLTYLERKRLENCSDIGAIDIYAYLLKESNLNFSDLQFCAEEYFRPEQTNSLDIRLYKTKCNDKLFDSTRKAFKKIPEYILYKIGIDKPEYDTGKQVTYLSYDMQDALIFVADSDFYHLVTEQLYNLRDDLATEEYKYSIKMFMIEYFNALKNKKESPEAIIERWVNRLSLTPEKIKSVRKFLLKEAKSENLYDVSKVFQPSQTTQFIENPENEIISTEKLNNITDKVVGQEKAITKIKNRLISTNLGFKQPNQPIASFLLTGPTGVGKTETAKAVANACFDGKIYVVDMSTFKNEIDVSRLTGGSPNYVGYNDKNNFCDFVKENPNSVILFDEIEKAHSGCLDLVMRILDEGQFINAKGEVISFENTVIFCTTNLTQNTTAAIGFGSKNNTEEVVTKGNGFKKEIVGRFSDVIEYEMLEKKDCEKIAREFLNNIILAFERNNKNNIKLKYTNDLVKVITEKANTRLLGARDLKKTIQSEFINVVADYIVTNKCSNVTLIVSPIGVKIEGAEKKAKKSTQKEKTEDILKDNFIDEEKNKN